MKAFTGTALLTLTLLLAGCGGDSGGNSQTATGNSAAPVETVAAPNGGDWTQTVAQSPEGGMVMGNPNAPVKVIEYASFTCPACANFSANGTPKLVDDYVKTGQVSFEFRHLVRDPADLAASLIARCGGPTPFFKLTEQLFASQNEWLGGLQTALTPAEQQAMQTMTPAQVAVTIGEKAGLIQFARMRGIPEEKARTCLADQQATERLVAMTNEGAQKYQVQGTPSFIINGKLSDAGAEWAKLEPQIRQALGK
jgi:protein-disulfide isomerase